MTLFEGADSTAKNDFPLTARSQWVSHIGFTDINKLFPHVDVNINDIKVLKDLTYSAIRYSQEIIFLGARPGPPHLQQYGAWIGEQLASSPERIRLDGPELAESIQSIADSLESTSLSHVAKAFISICSDIDLILTGKRNAYDVLVTDGVLEKVFEFLSEYDGTKFFRDLGHFKPNLRVLELGAGSGAATTKILQYLRHDKGQNLFSRYVLADASTGLLNAAKDRFKGVENLEFACLNIERDLADQDFGDEEFDLIIAAGFLHTTNNVEKSLSNIRKLLSPAGRLLIQEPASGQIWTKFILGTLPCWWADLDGRHPDEPFMGREWWTERLDSAGLGRHDFVEHLGQIGQSNVIIAQPDHQLLSPRKVTLLFEQASPETENVYRELQARGYHINLCTLSEIPITGQDIIALIDLDEPFLWDLSAAGLESFQQFVKNLQGSGVLWVTQLSQAGVKDPRYAPIIGLARTMRSELAASFATCEIDELASLENINALAKVFSDFQDREHDRVLGPEFEYAISKGAIFVNRFFPFELPAEI